MTTITGTYRTVTRRVKSPANLRRENLVDFAYATKTGQVVHVAGTVDEDPRPISGQPGEYGVKITSPEPGRSGVYAASRMRQVDATWEEYVPPRCHSCGANLENDPSGMNRHSAVSGVCYDCA